MKTLPARWRAVVVASLLFVGVDLASGPAAAQVPPADRAAAEALFRDARALATAGALDEACAKFAESHRLEPMVGTLLYLATCHEEQGRTATAWVEFNEAAAMARRAGAAEREVQATERARAVEKRLSTLTIQSPPGVIIHVAGREIRTSGTAIPVDPGPTTITATAAGKVPWKQEVVVAPGPHQRTIVVPDLAPVPAAEPVPRPRPRQEASGSSLAIAGYVVGGVGLASLSVGAIAGVLAAEQRDEADRSCDGSLCTQEGLDGHDAAMRAAWVSTITVGVGLAALGTGIGLVLWDDPATASPSPAVARVELLGGPARLHLRGRF